MAKTINIGYYFVALIDIVGQRDKLKQWGSLPSSEVKKQDTARILLETSEYVKDLRGQFDAFFNAIAKPTGLLKHLNPQQKAWAEQRKQTNTWRRGFSDSYIITVPCNYDSSWGIHALGISRSLFCICGLFIWALMMKKPFRGGVDVGLGTEISQQEVYGPVNVQVSELEKNAGYPCIVVGKGLLNHLYNLEQSCSNDPEGRDTKLIIQNCRGLLTTDHKGNTILDTMGDGVKSVSGVVSVEWINSAYEFILSQEEFFSKSDRRKEHDYYRDLRKYCESRLSLWGLSPI